MAVIMAVLHLGTSSAVRHPTHGTGPLKERTQPLVSGSFSDITGHV